MTHLIRADNEWRFDLLDEDFSVVTRNRRTLEPLSVQLPASEQRLQASRSCPFCDDEPQQLLDRVRGASGQEVLVLPSPTPLGFVEHGPPPLRAFASAGALAAHELLVASGAKQHGASLTDLDEETLALVLLAYCRRRAELAGDKRLGGVSLCIAPAALSRFAHAHATLLAAPFSAPRYSSVETCPGCRELGDARARGRVVVEGGDVVAYVPFAPRANVHVRLAAVEHGAELLSLAHAEDRCRAIARVLHDVIARIGRVAPGAHLLFRVCPLPLSASEDGRRGHLLLEVESLFDVDAVLSQGLSVRVLSVPPEDLAERLRAA